MRIGILGTGGVARTLRSAFIGAGHDVVLGSRTAGDDKVTFGEAVAHGEVLVYATAGVASVDAIGASDRTDRERKVLLDVADPLDLSTGELRLTVSNDDSLAETIQRTSPELRVVKSLNTVTASVMVDPGSVTGELGGIAAARGMEMYLPSWPTLMQRLGTPVCNVALERTRTDGAGE